MQTLLKKMFDIVINYADSNLQAPKIRNQSVPEFQRKQICFIAFKKHWFRPKPFPNFLFLPNSKVEERKFFSENGGVNIFAN